jgi:hypothetical protein
MPNLTQLITRQSGLEFWYPLTNDAAGMATVISDESGYNRDMGPVGVGSDTLTITANQLNGYKAAVHAADADPMAFASTVNVRDIYMVAKVDDTPDFVDPYRGLLSGVDDTNAALFVGVGSTTRWLSVAEGAVSMGYLLDDVLQPDATRAAPFDNFHRMRLSTSGAAVTLDGVQVGRDREHVDRLFTGKWADLMGFSTQRTADEDAAIGLYYDLKFGLWLTNDVLMNFPIPGMTGINYRHFRERPKDWDRVTRSHEYEDGGMSFNRSTDTPPVEWDIEFDCFSNSGTAGAAAAKLQYDIFDAFWDAVGTSYPFNFKDKYGVTHTNVRIKEYSRSHSANMSWKNQVAFRLCKYPPY